MAVRIPIALFVGAALPFLVSCTETSTPPHAGQPTPQGQSMQLMLADIEQIRAYVYGGSISRADAEKAAINLVSWSGRMAELFPPGQASTEYVDMEPARVSGAPEAMMRTAQQLLATVRTGTRAAVGDQLTRTERDGCGFCHLSGIR